MVQTTTLGYPRIGRNRELKRASEAYWAGSSTEEALHATGAALRRAHWEAQRDAGIDLIPGNDFSFYDHVLDTIALVGAVPPRFRWEGATVDLDTYFAMARGIQHADRDATAMEMTKWFDTNYHYIVPEWHADQRFRLASTKPFDEFAEARTLGIITKPVLLGPLSLVLLGKAQDDRVDLLGETLAGVVAVYGEVIARLAEAGARWIQLDEPCLAQDRTPQELAALREAYDRLAARKGASRLIVTTYFGHVDESYETLAALPVDGIGLDVLHGSANRDLLHHHRLPSGKVLVAGIVDGRNIWRANLDAALDILDDIATVVPPERLILSPTCSLLHVPYDVTRETGIDPEIRSWLAFADQKLDELVTISRAVNDGRASIAASLQANRGVIASRATSQRVHDDAVQRRLAQESASQRLPFAERRPLQAELLKLPPLPTTTIGSFPQTGEVRHVRSRFESGRITEREYDEFIAATIADTIARQEQFGFDVLVHGECERNDMVQYFGERLSGFVCTRYGWVQSYGSRYVRPPIIYGDVARPGPMTVRWSAYAQSLTAKPVKGMLTGPVTILNWSFVRDDQPRAETCRQIALALKDEVADLERAGLRIIQIDEPALREGLPLRRREWQRYLTWAVNCFRLASSGAAPATQIHSHMCYSSFEDILDAVSALDADVVSIENARDGGQLLNAFRQAGYDKQIGPGVYDVHSPRVPGTEEMEATLQAILDVLPQEDVWVNPDCGLKTRGWAELTPALEHLIAATHHLRGRISTSQPAL
jgi:5-methyltetrahydropteroyltriglutamate--homocysteine methyltransferase